MPSQEEKFTLFIENTDIGIFSFNQNHEFQEVNSKFCGMIGFDRHELFKFHFPEPFLPLQFYSLIKDQLDLFKQTGLLHVDTYFSRKNNTFFPVSLCGSIIPNQESRDCEYIIVTNDISNQKKAEREFKLSQDMLIALNNKLEQLVKKRTIQLQDVMKQKNEFINQLGHDLKNPLNPLLNLLPVLHQKAVDEESKHIIDVIQRNTAYMRDLIVKTIELAKLDSPNIPFVFEKFLLKSEIDVIIENNFTYHNEKNITITNQVPDDIMIDMDKLRLNELIINLVGNALKYGKEQGQVIIDAESLDDHHIQLFISDDGIGMSSDQLQKVFDEFYRVNQKNSTYKSSGLGMSICKKIMEKHGGTICCESPGVGKGTIVTCVFPKTHDSFDDEKINRKMEKKNQPFI